MSIDLHRYCATESDPREHLRAPWRDGSWVYATNGHLVIRVPAAGLEAPERSDKHPDTAALFRKYIEDRPCDFLLMPPLAEPEKCSRCDGAGFVYAIACPDCTDGTFWHGDWQYDCQNCAGTAAGPGWVDAAKDAPRAQRRPCDHCDFNGYHVGHGGATQIGEAHYATVYLWELAKLPQCRICPGDPAYANRQDGQRDAPAALIFDGGQALLMPRRAD
jgi:hypothetical protein